MKYILAFVTTESDNNGRNYEPVEIKTTLVVKNTTLSYRDAAIMCMVNHPDPCISVEDGGVLRVHDSIITTQDGYKPLVRFNRSILSFFN